MIDVLRGEKNTERVFLASHARTFSGAEGIQTRTQVTPERILSPCRLHFADGALRVAVCLNTT